MELSLRTLEEAQRSLSGAPPPTDGADPSSLQSAPSLMSFATKGAGRIPLHAVVQFVRLARSNSQKEVVEILADPVIQVTKVWNKIIVLYLSGQSVVYLPPVHFCSFLVPPSCFFLFFRNIIGDKEFMTLYPLDAMVTKDVYISPISAHKKLGPP